MQIFMKNVPFGYDDDRLKIELAKQLHRPPFPLSPPTNFHVDLFRKKDKKSGHQGCGLLTFPNAELGRDFLTVFEGGIRMANRVVRFSVKTGNQNQGLIQKVASGQWEDPVVLQRERRRMADESAPVRASSIAFGRYCRDGVFSAEVEINNPLIEISCDVAKRHLVVKVPPLTEARPWTMDSLIELLGPRATRLVQYPASTITNMAISTDSPFRVFLEASNPPIFQIQTANILTEEAIFQRAASLTEESEMPPVTQALCLTFSSPVEHNLFQMHCQSLHLPRPRHRDIEVESRGLYSQSAWRALKDILASPSIPFSLAFEIEKSIWNGTFVPSEITEDLRQGILQLASDAENASPIFKSFTVNVEIPGLVKTPIARPHRRRQRGRHRRRLEDEPPRSLAEQLEDAALSYRAALHQPRGRLATASSATTGIYRSYHVAVTPTGRMLEGPLPDQSNSVLRRFENYDCFLRLSFQDESRSKPRRDPGVLIDDLLRTRYKPFLVNGIDVAGHHYDFLGYSMSGLKEYSFSFVRPFEFQGSTMDAQEIRDTLGDFSRIQHKPALLGARWSQAFSASDPSVILTREEIKSIEDRYAEDGTVFTDGVGTISPTLAREVWSNLQKAKKKSRRTRNIPSAYQFRLGGAKGVLVQDPMLQGRVVCLRPSQLKFAGPSLSLDISSTTYRPISLFLNRPLIALLEYYGTRPESIISLQEQSIANVDEIHGSLSHASTIFSQHGLGSSFKLPSLFNNIHSLLGLDVHRTMFDGCLDYPLLTTCLNYGATHILRDIKHRAHIFVPGSVTLVGVADEWDCLNEGEIYAAVSDERAGWHEVITGTVMITRSPQIHPGDVQFVNAVRCDELAHLKNVVVFSCRGHRSLPSCLGGGDLDGDIYNLILDPELFPPRMMTGTPGSYAGLPHKETIHPCTVSDVADFVLDYIKTDLLGHISILHLRIADQSDPSCRDCLLLAQKASHAVDFPKTGTPVDFSTLPRPPSDLRPDFLSGEGVNPEGSDSPFYPSKKLLGHLYRNVPLREYHINRKDLASTNTEQIHSAFEEQGLFGLLGLSVQEDSQESDPETWEEMEQILEEYSAQLFEIAKVHTISKSPHSYVSEAELVSGTNQARWADHRRRREAVTAMNLQTLELTNAIRREIRRVPVAVEDTSTVADTESDAGGTYDDYSDEEDFDDYDGFFSAQEKRRAVFKRAWIAWNVSGKALVDDPLAYGPLSFGVIVLGMMLEIVKEERRADFN